jgi:hypothetical protein
MVLIRRPPAPPLRMVSPGRTPLPVALPAPAPLAEVGPGPVPIPTPFDPRADPVPVPPLPEPVSTPAPVPTASPPPVPLTAFAAPSSQGTGQVIDFGKPAVSAFDALRTCFLQYPQGLVMGCHGSLRQVGFLMILRGRDTSKTRVLLPPGCRLQPGDRTRPPTRAGL